MIKKYVYNLLISIDQLFNTILLGDPDETISSRMGKWVKRDGWRRDVAKPIAWFLDKLDKNHCEDAIEKNEGTRDLL